MVGLGLSFVLVAGPAAAAERPVDTAPVDVKAIDAKPVDGSVNTDIGPVNTATAPVNTAPTDVPPHDRPGDGEKDLEVLHLSCGFADSSLDVARAHVGCQWRAATSPHAAGYRLWRIVDRGERELIGRFGLDTLAARDVVPADAHVVRYAVLTVNENGRVVGQSRVQRIELGGDRGRDVEPVRARLAWPLAAR